MVRQPGSGFYKMGNWYRQAILGGRLLTSEPTRLLLVLTLFLLSTTSFKRLAAQDLPLTLTLSRPAAITTTDTAQLLAAQRLARISFVLQRISSQQVKAQSVSDPVFLPGSYPSYIHHRRHFKSKKKDITIFFNILIDLTLKKVRARLPDTLQVKVDTLLKRSAAIYPRFYNKQRGTYNFWLRDSAYRFPYSWWIPIIKKNGAVPDDMDDTVLARFINPKGDKDSLKKLHQLMQAYTVMPDKKLRTASKDYRQFRTYSTWFGDKFPVVLDAVVLSNILSFVNHYRLAWTGADSAALHFIVHSIRSGDYIYHPLAISPYYGKTSILLYHYSRLLQQGGIPALDSLRPALIQTCHRLIRSGKNRDFMEKILVANALAQLGQPAPKLQLPARKDWQTQVEQSDFAYFIGNIPSYMPRGIQGLLTGINAMMYYHYCPALNDALVLQYLLADSRIAL